MTNQEISNLWRASCVSQTEWRRSQNQAGAVEGEATGEYVHAEDFPRRAYRKPITDKKDDFIYCRAAREKIAADLAHDLGFPVPPALLTRHENRPAVVSLVMYPTQWPWEQIRSLKLDEETPSAAAMLKELSRASPLLAFDTWLGQVDHGDHNPHNIIWGYNPRRLSESALIFLDYAYSMGFDATSWADRKWETMKVAAFPPLILGHLDGDLLEDAISRIELLTEEAIRDIVSRIEDFWMPPDQREMVQEALIYRRKHLRTCLAAG